MQEACAICLVVDGRDGLMPFDEHVADYIRKLNKPVLLVVNKVDGMEKEDIMCADFHVLGFPIIAVSAEHGNQIRYLESLLVDLLPEIPDYDEEEIMHGLEEEDEKISAKKAKKAMQRALKDEQEKEELQEVNEFMEKGENAFSVDTDDDFDFENANPEDYLVDFNEEEFLKSAKDFETGTEIYDYNEQENSEYLPVLKREKNIKTGPLKICLLRSSQCW